jgi:hypothetical protein
MTTVKSASQHVRYCLLCAPDVRNDLVEIDIRRSQCDPGEAKSTEDHHHGDDKADGGAVPQGRGLKVDPYGVDPTFSATCPRRLVRRFKNTVDPR